MQLNNAMLSSSLEQRVVLRPSLEYYAQGRRSNPVHLRRGNSEVGSQASTTLSRMSSVSVEVFAHNEDVYGPFLRDYVRDIKGVKVVHLALNEMLLEQQEWVDIRVGRKKVFFPDQICPVSFNRREKLKKVTSEMEQSEGS
ncbi:uncharacterized protein LOC124169489 [Ischnura elegans]|uniref:uncharacterized protein LOC124169489 n=1 Tax=Ischnura elegans TaxID=197161 RepID=UPI001ED883A9|nr:uncharacterized protein LOC124169489 [Ischnura elegans]